LLASEFFSAWYLGRNPSHEIIFTTFSQDRADDVGKAVRNRMVHDVHGSVFPGATLKSDAKASRKFFTEKGGVFYATGWGGIITGRGASCLILDDLVKDRADALSKINRRKREEWFTSTAYSRLMPDEHVDNGRILLIMTRWAYDDIAAFLLKDLAHEGWHVLNCPAIAEEEDILGREVGEALWPNFRPLHVLENIKKSVSPEDWNALYQQKPLPVEGGLIKTNWFRRYDIHEMHQIEDLLKSNQTLPEKYRWFNKIVLSLDTAYKPNQINDPTGYTIWGYNKNSHYLLEAGAQRLEYPDLKRFIDSLYKKYTKWGLGPIPILIEDAASGQSLIQDLRKSTNYPVISLYPDKSKILRAEHVSDYVEAGRVFVPEKASWLTDFETELAQFPYGRHDDIVDSFTQYLKWVQGPTRRPSKKKIIFK
jgi:predicted phage terminase large subunit-like protein